jgi:hypothetical protein
VKAYFKTIVFVISPLRGYYRLGDVLQVYPCDYPNAPKSVHAQRHPCVLEYALEVPEPNPFTADGDYKRLNPWDERQLNRANSLRRLLSSITNHHFFLQDAVLKSGVWGIPKNADPNADTDEAFRSSWVEELYMWPEMGEEMYGARETSLSLTAHQAAPIAPAVAPDVPYHYYLDGAPKGFPDEVVFPDCAEAVLRAYEALDEKTQQTIDAITQLIDNGLALVGRMKSLSFLSFVSAIEALVALEITAAPETCEACCQPMHRVTKKFVQFLDTYVDGGRNNTRNKKLFSDIYARRSAIAHTGALLLGDAHEHWEAREKREKQFRLHKMAMQFARLSLVNWLLAREPVA